MNIIGRKIKALLRKEEIRMDSLGRWVVYKFTNSNKMLLLIIIYRILQVSDQGIYALLC